MMNGSFVRLKKGNDKKVFYLFDDGDARDMTKGLGKLIDGKEFNKIYHDLINNGWHEVEEIEIKHKIYS